MPPKKKTSTTPKAKAKSSTKISGKSTTPKAKKTSTPPTKTTSRASSTRQKNTAPGKPKAKKLSLTPVKKPSVRKTATKKPTFKRKELPIGELHPFLAFPFRLEYQDGKDKRVCHFECEEHRDKHIARYKLRKGNYAIDNFT